jgi:hypothetical protein
MISTAVVGQEETGTTPAADAEVEGGLEVEAGAEVEEEVAEVVEARAEETPEVVNPDLRSNIRGNSPSSFKSTHTFFRATGSRTRQNRRGKVSVVCAAFARFGIVVAATLFSL